VFQQRILESERIFAVPVPIDEVRNVEPETVSSHSLVLNEQEEEERETSLTGDPSATKRFSERQGIAATKWFLMLIDCWCTDVREGGVVSSDIVLGVLLRMLDKLGRLLKACARSKCVSTKAMSVGMLHTIETACVDNALVAANAPILQKLQGLVQAIRGQ
jgi:hypothetical protein